MPGVAKVGTPSLCTPIPDGACRMPPLLPGEDLAAGDPCCIKADGKAWKSKGTGAAGADAEVDGWAASYAKVAQKMPVTLMYNCDFTYGSGMTPGTFLYLADAGGVQTTAGTTQTKPIARVIDSTRLRAFRT